MYFLVLNGSEQKCARALFVKKTFILILLKKICAQKIHLQSLKCPRARNKRKCLWILFLLSLA